MDGRGCLGDRARSFFRRLAASSGFAIGRSGHEEGHAMIDRRTAVLGGLGMAGLATLPFPASASNPIVPGWYADPEIHIFAGRYWIYPTLSDEPGATEPAGLNAAQTSMRRASGIRPAFLNQTRMDAFSSTDLVHWTRHPAILDISRVAWAGYALWAPSAIALDGRYYLFFSANDIKKDGQPGGIGLAVADRPEGPFTDALGKPLIGVIRNGAQPIDPFCFRDDDGQHYLFYGGWGHCNVVRLSNDLRTVIPHTDGTTYKELTPPGYVEGSFMIRRNGRYYLMWSEGEWTGSDYRVAYATGDSALGPFTPRGIIMQQDFTVARGAGHHSLLQLPDSDDWIIAYHRRPLGTDKGDERVLALERLYFEVDGSIRPVKLTKDGVGAVPIISR
jgi:hypothetical protein